MAGEKSKNVIRGKKKRKWPFILVGIIAFSLVMGVIAALNDPAKRNGSDDYTREDYYNSSIYYIRNNYYADADIVLKDSKMWDNEGFREVQGIFKSTGNEHTFHIRFADKDIVLVEIDGVKEFSDVDKMAEFMDKQDKE